MSSTPAEQVVSGHPFTPIAALNIAMAKKKGKFPEEAVKSVVKSLHDIAINQKLVIDQGDIEAAFRDCISEKTHQLNESEPRSLKEYRWAVTFNAGYY